MPTQSCQIRDEISAVSAALARVEQDQQIALADITDNGVWVPRVVLDSKRRPVTKPGLNSAVSIVTATEKMRKTLTRKLVALNATLVTLEKPKSEWETDA